MKVMEVFEVPHDKVHEFFAEHIDEYVKITEVTAENVTFKIPHDYTEAEMHMFHLLKFSQSDDATPEEKDACNYAIAAIKTLQDMGVIDND